MDGQKGGGKGWCVPGGTKMFGDCVNGSLAPKTLRVWCIESAQSLNRILSCHLKT